MKKETARTLSQLCLISAILIVLITCGICVTGKTTYGPEEFYSKGDGRVGYGADATSSNTDRLALMLVVGGPVFILLLLASARLYAYSEELECSLPELSVQRDTPSDNKQTLISTHGVEPTADEGESSPPAEPFEINDPGFIRALKFVAAERRASTSMIQKHLEIGYGRAAEILDAMVREGFVGDPVRGGTARPILPNAYDYLMDISNDAKE